MGCARVPVARQENSLASETFHTKFDPARLYPSITSVLPRDQTCASATACEGAVPALGRFRRTSLTAASSVLKGLPGTLGVRASHSSPVLSCSPTFGQKTCRDISRLPTGSPALKYNQITGTRTAMSLQPCFIAAHERSLCHPKMTASLTIQILSSPSLGKPEWSFCCMVAWQAPSSSGTKRACCLLLKQHGF